MRATINVYRDIDKSSIYNGICTTRVFDVFVDSVEEIKLISESIIKTVITMKRCDENKKFRADIEGKFSLEESKKIARHLSKILTDEEKLLIDHIDVCGDDEKQSVDLTIYQMPKKSDIKDQGLLI